MGEVYGRDTAEMSLPPARMAHSDYTVKGIQDSVRYCRKDIHDAGKEALQAEDRKDAHVPRYAAYSVWRPIRTVKKDPIAACDWRTIDKQHELDNVYYRASSGLTESGDYLMTGLIGLPPQHPVKQKWYVCCCRYWKYHLATKATSIGLRNTCKIVDNANQPA